MSEIRENEPNLEPAPLVTYTLTIHGDTDELGSLILKSTVRWQDILRETEENLTELLPPGFRAEIKEWDA